MKPLRLHLKSVPLCPDAGRLFRHLFNGASARFLLESASLIAGFSRFSYMGDDGGPLGENVSYDINAQTLTRQCAGGRDVLSVKDLFGWLKGSLAGFDVEIPEGLPFDFDLGYVGVFGYELKAQTVGERAHASEAMDAGFILATRMLVLDHLEQKTYLLHLVTCEADWQRAEAWFDQVETAIHATLRFAPQTAGSGAAQHPGMTLEEVQAWIAEHASMRHDREAYLQRIRRSQHEIVQGESYEICLTNRVDLAFDGEPLQVYEHLRQRSPAPHAAYFNIGTTHLAGASPERFLSVDRQGQVEAKPIKGTRPRGVDAKEDARQVAALTASEKDRAENLMIVDLLRNDLGQVCEIGSVHVPALFAVETYSHVHQLVSTVRGRLKPGVTALDCVRASFPGGSMTGAPKKRTLEIIDVLEEGPRGFYAGALGWFGLGGACDFSIVIRSLTVHQGRASFGIGGAITALSDPDEEFEEIIVKARNVVEALRALSLS